MIIQPPEQMTFGLGQIDTTMLEDLSIPFTLEELEAALFSLNKGKAPGADGITVEFYIKFWQQLGPILLRWLQLTVSNGFLSGSASTAVITLIKKKGDPRLLNNWRPITLLSVDLKCACKALATRILPAVSSVIPSYQCALPGRSIHSVLAVVRDIISLARLKNVPMYVLALDQANAFDRVDHIFLFRLLQLIGLPALILDTIKALYTGFSCRVKNVSSMSRSFPYNRGIRQGDPLSTALYSLALQPVLHAMHLALPFEGHLLTNGKRLLCSAYADDITMYLYSPKNISAVLEVFKNVALFSGAALNLNKSTVAAFNLNKDMRESLLNYNAYINVSYDEIFVLGIHFTSKLTISQMQWNKVYSSTTFSINSATSILVGKSYVERAQWVTKKLWPRWAYLLKTLQPSEMQLNQLAVLLSEAVWLGGRHWLKHSELSISRTDGGLALISPKHKIDVFRVLMLCNLFRDGPSSPTFLLAQEIFDRYAKTGVGFKVLHTIPVSEELTNLPPVYRAAFKAWSSLPIVIFPQTKLELLELPPFQSKWLLQLDDPVVLSCGVARELGFFTIKDLVSATPSVTRSSSAMIRNAITAVEEWNEELISPNCNCKQKENYDNNYRAAQGPTFYLIVEDTVIHSCQWTRKQLGKLFTNLEPPIRNSAVPSSTWKMLFSSVAPNLFKNHFWRFLHGCVPCPNYYYASGVRLFRNCVMCLSADFSFEHQFSLCPVLALAQKAIAKDLTTLRLSPLVNHMNLYTLPTDSHRVANFLILSFVYAVIVVVRSVANYDTVVSPRRFLKIYRDIVANHLVIYARLNPPSNLDKRFEWQVFVHSNILAKFSAGCLYIRTDYGFAKYDEECRNIKYAGNVP